MRRIDKIYVHHSAGSPDTTVEQIRKIHIEEKGFDDIGYHFIITSDGKIHRCRPIEVIGAHCKGDNRNSIGICVPGNFMHDKMDAQRYVSLITLCYGLYLTFGELPILGHKDKSNTLCPGDNPYLLLPDLKLRVNYHFNHTTVDCGSPLFADIKKSGFYKFFKNG